MYMFNFIANLIFGILNIWCGATGSLVDLRLVNLVIGSVCMFVSGLSLGFYLGEKINSNK